ncbi:MAG: SWIB/MDM2 domain-containing protein [Sphingomonadales bacterium]
MAAKSGGIHAPVTVSSDLEAIIGKGPMPRSEVTSKIWAYVKKNNLQKPTDKRTIVADEKLKKIFGKAEASMFEMTKFVSAHLNK